MPTLIGPAAKLAANATFTGINYRGIATKKLKNYALNTTPPTWQDTLNRCPFRC